MPSLQERFALIFGSPPPRGVPARIARACGVSGPTVSAWFNQPEKVSSIERANAEKICAEFDLAERPEWLAEGTGPRVSTETGTSNQHRLDAFDSHARSSGAFTLYERDVSISIEGFARMLDEPQRAALRNTLRVMLADPLNFVKLDLNRLLSLLADNSYTMDAAERPTKRFGQPIGPVSQPVTKRVALGHRSSTDVARTPPRSTGDKP